MFDSCDGDLDKTAQELSETDATIKLIIVKLAIRDEARYRAEGIVRDHEWLRQLEAMVTGSEGEAIAADEVIDDLGFYRPYVLSGEIDSLIRRLTD